MHSMPDSEYGVAGAFDIGREIRHDAVIIRVEEGVRDNEAEDDRRSLVEMRGR